MSKGGAPARVGEMAKLAGKPKAASPSVTTGSSSYTGSSSASGSRSRSRSSSSSGSETSRSRSPPAKIRYFVLHIPEMLFFYFSSSIIAVELKRERLVLRVLVHVATVT